MLSADVANSLRDEEVPFLRGFYAQSPIIDYPAPTICRMFRTMNGRDWIQLAVYFGALVIIAPFLGRYLAAVFTGALPRWMRPLKAIECRMHRLAGCTPEKEMSWSQYAAALLWFNFLGLLALLGLQVAQQALPLNPENLPNVPWLLAINTAVSFVTNTNWQAYSGEATMSYLTQMLGLTAQNFISAATGMAVLLALARGMTRKSMATVGNFWADLVRCVLYVLLPLSLLLAIALVTQGVVQTFSPYVEVTTLEGANQVVPLGPAASQIAIKQLGTNGGGFFGVNSAHPFENPTPLTNFLQMFAILLLPAAQVFMFGRMVGSRKHAWALFGAMLLLLLAGLGISLSSEFQGNMIFPGIMPMEGKETRFGVMNSVLWAVTTTAASNGSVNAMHDSLMPLSGLTTLFNIMLGEVVFGGVGAGLYGMLAFVILTVFMAGLMVGRSPEYLGKRIEKREVIMAMIAVLAPCVVILSLSSLALMTEAGRSSISNSGPHGLSQVLYAFSSMAGNNGSAFAGLNANTPFYNLLGVVAMLIGRYAVLLPMLAIAGSLATKKACPPTLGTFPTDGMLFVILLMGVVCIVGALTFLPALTLGPLVEQLLMQQGRVF
jgi:K+-transporting ATPase ATPase A chain